MRHQADAAVATGWRNLRPAPPVIDPQRDDVHHLERAEPLIGRTGEETRLGKSGSIWRENGDPRTC